MSATDLQWAKQATEAARRAPFAWVFRAAHVIALFAFPPAVAAAQEAEPPGQAPTAAVAEWTVVFARDVEPIFRRRCIACHGPRESKGGLRLHDRKFAEQGGDSGVDLLAGPVDGNELLRRVTSSDKGHRMPLEGPPLADNEVDTLRRWIEQGAVWPQPEELVAHHVEATRPSPVDPWWVDYTQQGEAFMQRLGYAPYLMLGVLILGLVINRLRARFSAAGGFHKLTRPSVQAAVVAGVVIWGFVAYALSLHRELDESRLQLAQMRAALDGGGETSVVTLHDAYVPPRPERSVAATYYRGNDERSPDLFNGGFYRTATFHLALCDRRQQPLDIGAPVGEGPLYIRFEIERAPRATEHLFTDNIMDMVRLSPVPTRRAVPDLASQVVSLQMAAAGQSWVGYYPVPLVENSANATVAGIFYVCKGSVQNDAIVGSLHYQVEYDLRVVDGKLAEGSNLAMGSLYRVGNLQVAEPGKIQHNEWFDSRPIPVITGENSSDPKLLGVEEHLGEASASTTGDGDRGGE